MRIWLVIVVGYWQCVWKKIVSVFVFLFFLFIKYCIIKMIDCFAWSVGRKKSYWNSVAYWLKWLKQKEMLKRAAEKMVRNDEPVTNSILLQLKIPMNHLQIYKYSAVLCICVWMSCFLRYKKKNWYKNMFAEDRRTALKQMLNRSEQNWVIRMSFTLMENIHG